MSDAEVPVLIVGGGPVGLAASFPLSRHRVSSLLVERHHGTSVHPKARGLNARTMELFRVWGLEAAVRGAADKLNVAVDVVWAPTLVAPEVRRAPYGGSGERLQADSPTTSAGCGQDALEPILAAAARSYDLGDLRFGHELTHLVQGTTGVEATVVERAITAERTRRVAAQSRQRLAGTTPAGSTRIVSLHDPDARPIVKGRLGKPVEFGYKALLVDNEDGVIVDHNVEVGNPADGPQLEPAIRRIKQRTGRAPRAVTADRGYGEAGIEDALRDLGVRHIVLPTKGKPTVARRQIENRRAFQHMVRWRTGCEGRISCARRDFGLARTRLDGIEGARTWCGHGVFAHNLIKISGFLAS